MSACSPTRRLSEDQLLLDRNRIIIEGNKTGLSGASSFIIQRPNRKLLGLSRFWLQMHNLSNPKRVERRKQKLQIKRIQKNERRVERGKSPKNKTRKTIGEFLMEIGEPPVILDTISTIKSETNLKVYAQNRGFFRAEVSSETHVKRKKATLNYTIRSGQAYRLNEVNLITGDSLVDKVIQENINASLLKSGDIYDLDKLDRERMRIQTLLRNNGFFGFTRSNISFAADSTKAPFQIDLNIQLQAPKQTLVFGKDSVKINSYRQFIIRNVIFESDFSITNNTDIRKNKDTINGFVMVYKDELKYKPKTLIESSFIEPGTLYSALREERTYKKLSELRNFRFINISYEPVMINDTLFLNCFIRLTPTERRAFSIETQGTNTGGFLGVASNITYSNFNVFKGAEILDIRLVGGLEVQPEFGGIEQGSEDLITDRLPFNTLEYGGELVFRSPRFLTGIPLQVRKRTRPITTLRAGYNYQERQEYRRTILNFSYGFEWFESSTKRHFLNPFELNFVNVFRSKQFSNLLLGINDQFLLNSFTSNVIPNLSYTFIYSDFRNENDNSIFLRVNGQIGGTTFYIGSRILNAPQDSLGRYSFTNIPFAQFIRAEYDFRYTIVLNPGNRLVYRVFTGIGLPYANSFVMPFEKAFFAGGANDIRGWQARRLGVGSYKDPEGVRVDQFGDLKFVVNLEYRFKLGKIFEGATFIDAGNIWLFREDSFREGGNFRFNEFYREIAVAAGIGLRLNFGFFIFRVDPAVKVYNPALPIGQRFRISRDGVVNLGIGYPF